MARAVVKYTVTTPGRDLKKVFVLTEMPAEQAEKWAVRALMALARHGVDLPVDAMSAGIAGVARLGLSALAALPFAEAEPLLDEMFGCVAIQTESSIVRSLVPDDIEEVATRFLLRQEVMRLHLGFFPNVGQLITELVARMMVGSVGSPAPTSPAPSMPSGAPAAPASMN